MKYLACPALDFHGPVQGLLKGETKENRMPATTTRTGIWDVSIIGDEPFFGSVMVNAVRFALFPSRTVATAGSFRSFFVHVDTDPPSFLPHVIIAPAIVNPGPSQEIAVEQVKQLRQRGHDTPVFLVVETAEDLEGLEAHI